MLDDPSEMILLVALAGALLVAAFTDLKRRQIANWLNAGIALLAPVWWWASGVALWSATDPWHTVVAQIGLAVATFVIGAILFALRAMGGGDVKILAALALWIPPELFLQLLVVMALAGGVLTILFSAWHIMKRRRDRLAIPYGVAIAFAGLWVLGTAYIPAGATPSQPTELAANLR